MIMYFLGKNRRKIKQCHHNDIWRWKSYSFPVKLKLEEEDIKKENLKKKSTEFIWDKSPD